MIAPIRVKLFDLPALTARPRPARETTAEPATERGAERDAHELAKLTAAKASLDRVEQSAVLREVE